MAYFTEYRTPIIGMLSLASDGEGIVGCWFDNDRYFGYGVEGAMERRDDLAVFDQARAWLDRYFAGDAPDPRELPLAARATEFQLRVREAMLDIPYGETTTYGAIAKRLESETGKLQSARAVGGAVGHNPLCLIVPCHRVVGSNGSLTGFGGGIPMKVALLERYRRRYSPYGSVASLYLWAVSHMDVPGYDRDYAPMTEAQKKAARKKRAAARKQPICSWDN